MSQAISPRCPNCAWAFKIGRERRLPTAERMILIAIAERADRRTLTWDGTISDIMDDTGLSRRTVNYVLHPKEGKPHTGLPPDLVTVERIQGGGHRFVLLRDVQGMHNDAPDDVHIVREMRAQNAQPYNDNPLVPPVQKDHKDDPSAQPPDPKEELWTKGPPLITALTGQLNGQARGVLGRFLKQAAGDCTLVLGALVDATRERPHEPVPWIMAAIRHRLDAARQGPREFDPNRLTFVQRVAMGIEPIPAPVEAPQTVVMPWRRIAP